MVNVPTANVVLNWATGKSEAHNLDANLSTITVRSADGFKFNLDVAQIIHIPRNDAPKVIARFGDMSALVTQVLEPTIGNYFRNAAQGSDIKIVPDIVAGGGSDGLGGGLVSVLLGNLIHQDLGKRKTIGTEVTKPADGGMDYHR